MSPTPARVVAAAVAFTVVVGSQQWGPAPEAHAATPSWKPALQQFKSVPVAKVAGKQRRAATVTAFTPDTVVWPVPEQAAVDLDEVAPGRPERAGTTPVRIAPAEPKHGATARVRVLDRTSAEALVGPGVVTVVETSPDTPLAVKLDYSGFAAAAGGGYASRLRLVQLPGCALTTPERPECRHQTPVESTNDLAAQELTAQITPADAVSGTPAPLAMTVLAAAADTSSEQGDFTATSLKPSSTWASGAGTGEFTWSYPMRVPATPGGTAPTLELAYSSGGTDGGVSNTNNQSSWVGEGFELASAFIERKYVSCYDDRSGGNNKSSNAVDLCWDTDARKTNNQRWDNAFLSMAGHAGELVRIGNTAEWRLEIDDGTRVAKLGGVGDNEYWRVTTPDGTRYFFGKGRSDNASAPATNARWSVPVAANNDGEPGYKTAFGSSFASQPWRWNLDYVIAPTGATTTYYYVKETNKYKKNLATSTSYDRGGYLKTIQYGERAAAETDDDSSAKVTFTVEERCDTSLSASCLTAKPKSSTAKAWPDVPMDAVCDADYCPDQKYAPTFFTRKRLAKVETFTRNSAGTGWEPVDAWVFGKSFPEPSDGAAVPSLWLSSIVHSGQAGTAISLPAVTLDPIMLDSRISGSGVALEKPRLATIISETGARTIVEYSAPECTNANLPAESKIPTNITRCMPVYYSSGTSAPTLQWFNKYVVDSVTERDLTGMSDSSHASLGLDVSYDVVTAYSYDDAGGAWRYNDSPLVKAKYRTWSEWRGYTMVTASVGSGATRSVTESTYFRGMNGDKAASGVKTVDVTDSTGASWPDEEWFQGLLRETRTLTAAGGVEDARTISDPRAAPGASDGRLTSHQVAIEKTTTRQRTSSGHRATIERALAWDSYGQPTLSESEGDTGVSGDETCTRTTYAAAADAGTGPIDRIAAATTMPALCATPEDLGQVISATRHYFDGATTHTAAVGLPGLVTTFESLTGSGSTRGWTSTSRESYDQWGRVTTSKNALGNTTTTAYTHTAGGRLSGVVLTSADPDGSGPATPLTTTTSYDTRLGLPTKAVQPGGQTTEAGYDALGRITQVWQPGRSRATQTASTTYDYTVSPSAPSTVTTRALLPSGSGYATSVTLLDSFLRTRQVQTPAAAGVGRLVTDTRYDSRGNPVLTDSYYNGDSDPTTTLVTPTSRTSILTSHRYSFDFAGRQTRDGFYSAEALQWETTTGYTGDTVTTDPPAGGTPTTVVSDVFGRTTQLIQHLGTNPTAPGVETSYRYDPAGNLTSMTDAKGNEWSYTWDLAGNKLTSDDPDKGVSSMTYDAVNRLTSSTDARGVTLKYFYDALGRATGTTKADGTTTLTSTTWDTVVKGLQASTSRHLDGGTFTQRVNAYDSAGRPTSSTTVVPAIAGLIDTTLAGSYTSTATYNPDGSLATQSVPAAGPLPAETLAYAYTARLGQADTLTGTLGATTATYLTDTQYSVWGTIAARLFGTHSGKAGMSSYVRDPASLRLTAIGLNRQVNPGHTDEYTTLAYDPAGNITQVRAALDGGQVDNQCFGYDYQRQLTEAWTPSGDGCEVATRSQAGLSGPAPYWTSWATDVTGKTTSRTDRTTSAATTTSYAYPADGTDSVTPHFITGTSTTGGSGGTASYAADAAGNTISRPGVSGEQSLVWDDQNQLTTITENGVAIAQMAYDASGARILRRQGDTTTIYLGTTELTLTGQGVQAPLAGDGSGAPILSGLRYYTHGGETVAVRSGASNDTVVTLVSDWQGTTHHQMRNATGELATTWQNPYGQQRGAAPVGWAGERSFVGGTRDATGLIRVGARDYDPRLGRFITVDPLQDLADPLQWNGYVYANNSPLANSDPSGLAGDNLIDGMSQHGHANAAASRHASEQQNQEQGARSTSTATTTTGSSAPKVDTPITPHPDAQLRMAYAESEITNWGWGTGQTYPYVYEQTDEQKRNDAVMASVLGFDIFSDIGECGQGGVWGCAGAAATLLPFARLGKIGKLLTVESKVAANSGDELLNAARAARDAKAAEVGRSKATVTGGYGRDGRVAAGCASNPVGCAEDDVARQIGGNPKDITFTEAVRPRTGEQVPICPRCQGTYDQGQFPQGTLFDPAGPWGSR